MAFQFNKFIKAQEPELSEDEIKRAMLPGEAWLLIMALLLVYTYYAPLYLENTGGFLEGFLLMVIPLLSFPFLLYKSIRSYKPKSKLRIWLPVLSLFVFPALLMFLNHYLIENELRSNGTWKKGIVTEEFREYTDKQKKKVKTKHLFCEYSINTERYRSELDVRYLQPDLYKPGDSIDVIYSKEHANIHACGIWAEKYKPHKSTNN